jgi:AcrR family transcriptional regulator
MRPDLPVPPSVEDDPAVAWRGRRRRRDHGHKRAAVIRTAARAFDERGYHNTSLDDIAAALGVSKPTIYYYVPNKEQLLFECFRAGLEPIHAALLRAGQSPGTSRDRLREVIRDYALAIASEYGWCMVRAEHQDLGAELSAQVRALKSDIDRGIRQLLQAGIDDGSVAVADPKLAAFAIAGALNWIGHWFRAGRSLSAEHVAEAFVQFLELGLAPRQPELSADTSSARRKRPSPRP